MKAFEIEKLVRFQHCDPGGVVFTPQYFNLFTEVVEDWFSQALQFSFSQMVVHQRQGIPAMKIVAKFTKPSYLGDRLTYALCVKRLRKSSVLVSIAATCNSEKRCAADFLFGFSSLAEIGLTEWPQDVFVRMQEFEIL